MLRKRATVDTFGTNRKFTEDVRHLTDTLSMSLLDSKSELTLLATCVEECIKFDSICQDTNIDTKISRQTNSYYVQLKKNICIHKQQLDKHTVSIWRLI